MLGVALALFVPTAMLALARADESGGVAVYALSSTTDETGRAIGYWEAVEKAQLAPYTTTDETGRAIGYWEAVEKALAP